MKTRVLLAEDEVSLGQIIKESLEMRDFEVIHCINGEEAFNTYQKENPELLVLDVMMPKKDGFSLAKEIRHLDRKTPIIFLTSKSQTKDVIEGFEHGGNDYLKKPFSMEELIVRIKALLDRVKLQNNEEAIQIGGYTYNRQKQTLHFKDDIQQLTHKESELLFQLSENRNETLDRALVLKKIWGDDDFFTARSMDVFVSKLRKKLSSDPNIQILNVRGFGYKLVC